MAVDLSIPPALDLSLTGVNLLSESHLYISSIHFKTGITPLDAILGGGIPYSKIIEVAGAESQGKSSFALSCTKRVIDPGEGKPKGYVLYVDCENSWEADRVASFGIPDELRPVIPYAQEDCFDAIINTCLKVREAFLKYLDSNRPKGAGGHPRKLSQEEFKVLVDKWPLTLVIFDTFTSRPTRNELTGARWCFSEDTKIKCTDGVIRTIKEVDNEIKAGKKIWVYSYDLETKSIVPGKVIRSGISTYTKDTCLVTLDNGHTIKCTPDHRFMLRDGTYKEAKDLTQSDSLMRLYTRISHKVKKIEIIHNNTDVPMYDLTIDGYHNFSIEVGGSSIVVSNSGGIAERPIINKMFLRHINTLITGVPIIILLLNQVMAKIGSFGGGMDSPGGQGLKHFCHGRLFVHATEKVANDSGSGRGVWVRFHTVKNKLAPPWSKAFSYLDFQKGFLDSLAIFDFLDKAGLITSGGWRKFKTYTGKEISFRMSDWEKMFNEDPKFAEFARLLVYEKVASEYPITLAAVYKDRIDRLNQIREEYGQSPVPLPIPDSNQELAPEAPTEVPNLSELVGNS